MSKEPHRAELFVALPEVGMKLRAIRDRRTQAVLLINPVQADPHSGIVEILDDSSYLAFIASYGAGFHFDNHPSLLNMSLRGYATVILVFGCSDAGRDSEQKFIGFLELYFPGLIASGEVFRPDLDVSEELDHTVLERDVLDPATRKLRVFLG